MSLGWHPTVFWWTKNRKSSYSDGPKIENPRILTDRNPLQILGRKGLLFH